MNDISLYFDYAAASPIEDKVLKAMQPFFIEKFYNPSAIYQSAINVKHDIEDARHSIAQIIGARPPEVIFTAGGTEANNLAISGLAKKYPGKHFIASAIEHHSVLKPISTLNYSLAPVNEKGLINVSELASLINNDTILISIMMANNEVGTIQPIREIAELIKTERINRRRSGNKLPIYLHSDACQAVNYLDINVARLGVDMLTINSGKIYGPKQCGLLYVKAGVIIDPIILGGGQEHGLRSGTENATNIIGFSTALQITQKKLRVETDRLSKLRDLVIKDILAKIPNVVINGAIGGKRIANNINITIKDVDNERLLMELDELGIKVATGSACSASNDEPSHVLTALGKTQQQIYSSLRITLGRYTTESSCQKLVESLIYLTTKK